MRRILLILVLAASALASAPQADDISPPERQKPAPPYWESVKASIERHLKRPYVWGAAGMKSFDCSGFVWRVMADNGVLIKRTTARKLYLSMPPIPDEKRFTPGTLVFFNDLKHCGIVASEKDFYHAECSIGTNLSKFNSYWRPKVYGFRAFPK